MRDRELPGDDPGGAVRGAGLCNDCRHQRVVRTGRGSAFSLCELSRSDESFPRYPRLPVASCSGHQRRPRANDADGR